MHLARLYLKTQLYGSTADSEDLSARVILRADGQVGCFYAGNFTSFFNVGDAGHTCSYYYQVMIREVNSINGSGRSSFCSRGSRICLRLQRASKILGVFLFLSYPQSALLQLVRLSYRFGLSSRLCFSFSGTLVLFSLPIESKGRRRPHGQNNAGCRMERPGGTPARWRTVVGLFGRTNRPGKAPVFYPALLPEEAAVGDERGGADGGRCHGRDGGAGAAKR